MNWLLLKNSLLVGAATTLCSVLLGFFAALWFLGLERRWRNLVLAAGIVALALPPFLVTNCWLHLLGLSGIWRNWLPLNILSLGGTVWILVLMTWPVTFFFALAALRKIEKSYFEVDPILRGGKLVRWLLWPMVRREIAQAAVLTFVLALNNFAVPAILQVKVFPAEVWVSFNTTFDYAAALRLSWPLLVAPLSLLYIFRQRKVFWSWEKGGVSAQLFRKQFGTGYSVMGGIVAATAIVFSVVVPLGQICLAGQTWSAFSPALTAGQSALLNSFVFAAMAASVVVVVSILTSRWPLQIVTWIPFLIPGVVVGIALIWVFNRSPFTAFYQSVGIVVVAFAIRYLAPGWNTVVQALQSTDRNLNDAARIEGANNWQLFRYVQLPQIFPALCAAWYVTYLFCLWDVETLVLIVPPGHETVALRIFNLLHYGHNSQVNALCLWLLVLAVLPLLVWSLIKLAGQRINVVVSMLLFAVLFSGCSPSAGKKYEAGFPIESKIFSHVEVIGARGTAPGQFNKPRSLALDKNDNLFVVDMTGRVQKFSSNGVYVLSWQMPQTDLGKAKGMCCDKDGNIVVVEPHYQRVNHFSSDGKLVAQWGGQGTNAGQLVLPRAVAVNSRGEIIVSEYTTVDRVQVFAKDGQRGLHIFGKSGAGNGELNRPEGLGVDAQDRIYVADSCNHRIQVFSPEGKFLRSYGKAGSHLGEVSYPYDVRVDSAGLQYVCEFGNSRIQIFDVKDQPFEIVGSAGAEPGQFANPWSIALDSKGNLYVADSQNHRVQKFVRKDGARTALSARSPDEVLKGKQHFIFYRSRNDSDGKTFNHGWTRMNTDKKENPAAIRVHPCPSVVSIAQPNARTRLSALH